MAVARPPSIARRVCVVGAPGGPPGQLEQLLRDQGYLVWGAPDTLQLAERLHPPPDVILLDARADSQGVGEALATLCAGHRTANAALIALLPAAPAAEQLDLLTAAGADFVAAPVHADELLARITMALGRGAARRQAEHEHARLSQEQAALQRALKEHQARSEPLHGVFERLPLAVMLVSPVNLIEQVNPAMCRFLGYEAAELIGRQPGFMVLPEDHAATLTPGYQLAAGQIDHFVHDRRRHVRKDGTIALGRLTVFALRNEAGTLEHFLAFVEDVSVRVRVEDELSRYTRYQDALATASLNLLAVAPDGATRARALAQALQQLVDGAHTGRAYLFRNVHDPQLGLGMICAAEAWGAGLRPLREMAGAKLFPFLPYAALPAAHRERLLAPLPAGGRPEELYAANPVLLAAVLDEGIRSTQTVPVMVDGAHWGFIGFDEHARSRVWDHADQMLLTSAATMVGQTLHRWQIEDDLRATSRFLAATGRVARVGGWAIDLVTRAATISDELAAILELEPGPSLDLDTLLSFYEPAARPALRAAIEATIRDGTGWELELPAVTAGGRRLWVRTQGMAEQHDGSTVRLLGTLQDVTPRKEAELRLERQLHIEGALARCSQELLAPVQSEGAFRTAVSAALEHLRSAIGVEQASLMRHVPGPDEPYLTMAALASVPTTLDPYESPLAQRFPLSLLPPRHLACLDEGRVFIGFPREDELITDAQRAWMAVDQARSRLSIPMRIDDQLWGVLGFSGLSPREWGAEDIAVLVTAAGMLGHVIRRWLVEQELRQSEEQFRTAVETMLDGFAILDSVRDTDGAVHDFRFRYINQVGSRMNQRPREEHLGHTLLELLPVHAGSALFDDYVRLVETGAPVSRESLVYEDAFGAGERLARVVDVRATRLGDGMAVVWRDVTDRHLAHESLALANDDLLRRVNELRTLNLLAQTLASTRDLSDGLAAVCHAVATRTGATQAVVACFERTSGDADRDPRLVSDPAGTLLTLTAEELGPSTASLLDLRRPVALARSEPAEMLSEATLRRLGLDSAAYLLLAPLTSAAGNLGLLALGSDSLPFGADDQSLVETIAGQAATAISNAWLAEQAQHAARLAERNRVARDLHDSATQALYSLSLIAAGWALHAEQGPLSDVPAKFNQLGGIALQVLKELRLLIYELRHPDLAAAGLVKALEERLAAVEQRATIRTSLTVSGEVGPLPQRIEEQVFTLLQEALNNALRHAQARSVAIGIHADGDHVVCTVRDDGVGFELDRPSSGLGLRSMRERAAAIGAQIHFASTLGQGTLVELHIPIAKPGGKAHG